MDEMMEKLGKTLGPNKEPQDEKELVRYYIKAL